MGCDAYIHDYLVASGKLRLLLAQRHIPEIADLFEAVRRTLASGNKVLLCGNGGSASDAEHIAAELVGRFRRDRGPLPAIALTCNGADLTAIANDFGFDQVFSRQIEALGQPGDLLLALSTSGKSANIREAVKAARRRGLTAAALTGINGGEFAALCDLSFMVPSGIVAHIQECHMTACHMICEAIDEYFLNEHRPAEMQAVSA